ncbi:hypothetical protein VTN49DRAFT_6261 [Thermomyces lanuginosus]|uniref:uncharacterized protein n=1 Tax=Thermomyces lanuginosus TaxID=5541 RepID=UPI003744391B
MGGTGRSSMRPRRLALRSCNDLEPRDWTSRQASTAAENSTDRQGNKCAKMSAQNSAGIQTLLDAEREAQKIVQQAREYRTKRIKDARTEAQREIDEYRRRKEEEFKKFEAEHTSGYKKAEEEADRDAEGQLAEIREVGKKVGDKVVEDLIAAVVDVRPEVPEKIAAA